MRHGVLKLKALTLKEKKKYGFLDFHPEGRRKAW